MAQNNKLSYYMKRILYIYINFILTFNLFSKIKNLPILPFLKKDISEHYVRLLPKKEKARHLDR
jgi:hypothetical protein